MRHWGLGGATAAAVVLSTGAGSALTPEETWAHWQTQAEAFGLTLTAESEEPASGQLTLREVSYVGDWDFARIVYRPGTLTLRDQGDGTVAVDYPDASDISFRFAPEGEPELEGTASMTHSGGTLVVSQEGDMLTETTRLPQTTLTLDSVTADGEPLEISAAYSASGVVTNRSYPVTGDPMFGGDLTIDSSEGGYEFSAPGGQFNVSSNTRMIGVTGSGEVALGSLLSELQTDLTGADEAQIIGLIGRVFDSGFRISGTSAYESYESVEETTTPNGTAASRLKITEATGDMTFSGEGLDYTGDTAAFEASFTIPGVPIPEITVSGTTVSQAVTFPLVSGDAPAPFALKMAVGELNVGETIWAMFDPAGALPRDPASLALDLTGQLIWLSDLFSAETLAAETPPVEPVSVDLANLSLTFAGAELTGSGAFAFDSADKTTFPGMPRPEGSASFTLVGGNGLLDRLTQIGIVPQDQVMVVRMMAGMLTLPGPGPDELRSEIAIDGSGQVLINGAPIPF